MYKCKQGMRLIVCVYTLGAKSMSPVDIKLLLD